MFSRFTFILVLCLYLADAWLLVRTEKQRNLMMNKNIAVMEMIRPG